MFESKVSVDAGFEQLKFLGRGIDGGWKRVPVFRSFTDKWVVQCVSCIFIYLNSEVVLWVL